MSILPHGASKLAYGGESMPEGMDDCNSCGFYAKESYFYDGLCSSCGPCEEMDTKYNDDIRDETWYGDDWQ